MIAAEPGDPPWSEADRQLDLWPVQRQLGAQEVFVLPPASPRAGDDGLRARTRPVCWPTQAKQKVAERQGLPELLFDNSECPGHENRSVALPEVRIVVTALAVRVGA
jgi:hypothetical protein